MDVFNTTQPRALEEKPPQLASREVTSREMQTEMHLFMMMGLSPRASASGVQDGRLAEELGALPWDSGYRMSLTEPRHPPLRISD